VNISGNSGPNSKYFQVSLPRNFQLPNIDTQKLKISGYLYRILYNFQETIPRSETNSGYLYSEVDLKLNRKKERKKAYLLL